MKEAQVVRGIVEHFRKALPAAAVLKHADRVTRGIPDLSFTYGGNTLWCEVKRLSPNETRSGFREKVEPLQLALARHLEAQGACLYFISFIDGEERASVMRPHQVARLREAERFDLDILAEYAKFTGGREAALRFLQSIVEVKR